VRVLGRDDLTEVLIRLGIHTLGAFAALPAADVSARFGPDAVVAHRLAGGLDEQAPRVAPLPAHLMFTAELDPPVERVDQATFVAKGLVEQLHEALRADGLCCTRVCIGVETIAGECNERIWRHGDSFDVGALIDRMRWQLDGWLNGPAVLRPTSGISRLTLIPDEVGPAKGRQLGFWGGESAADARAARALARAQGIVGVASVMVPEVRGGRSPAERIVRVPVATTELGSSRVVLTDDAPWPGRVPTPSPALLVDEPVRVCDAKGAMLAVSGRGLLSAAPAFLESPGSGSGSGLGPIAIEAWAGPWLSDERWWDPDAHLRRARLQLLLRDGRAVLVACEHGAWCIEGWYD
jgi:protein ImuB